MAEPLNILSIHASAFSIAQRKRLLSSYQEYVSLMRNFEYIVKKYKIGALASFQLQCIYDGRSENNPWYIEPVSAEERDVYDDFLNARRSASGSRSVFVSLNYTNSEQNAGAGIMSAPKDYKMISRYNNLPSRIERYVAAFPQDEKIAHAKFIVDGRYAMVYDDDKDTRTINEVLQSPSDEKKFYCMLDILAQCPHDVEKIDAEILRAAQTETLASEMTAPFENMIITALASLAEEADRVLRILPMKINKSSYLQYAENNGVIPSAARMQEFLNIRHLLHHQWDTLDNIGRFTSFDNNKNFSVRQRYLDAYHGLCGSSLSARLDAYIAAAADFSKLAAALNPELFIRSPQESNSKFIARIKEYARQNPEAPFWVEANYAFTAAKKASLLKNISRLFPQGQVIDLGNLEMESFISRAGMHIKRRNYLEYFQRIEYQICRHFLLRGRSQTPLKSWKDLAAQEIISPEEAKMWAEFKKLRNDLSHHGMNEAMEQRLDAAWPSFTDAVASLQKRLEELCPSVYSLQGNIFRAEHADGTVVDIDFAQKRVLNVIGKDGCSVYKDMVKTKPARRFTEEYRSGVSITTAGTEIVSCRLPDGINVNFQLGIVKYPDGAALVVRGKQVNLLVSAGTKVVMDKQFNVVNVVIDGRSVSVAKKEILLLPKQRKLMIGADNRPKAESWLSDGRGARIGNYRYQNDTVKINLGDTVITVSGNNIKLSRGSQELSYETRKAFAESYAVPQMQGRANSAER